MKKKKDNSAHAFALRIALALTLTSISAIIMASTLRPPAGPQPDRPVPDVVAMAGPVSQDLDLRALPYVAPNEENEEVRLTRHPFPLAGTVRQTSSNPGGQLTQQLMDRVLAPIPNMPSPIQTFPGLTSAQACRPCCGPQYFCLALENRWPYWNARPHGRETEEGV